MDYIIYLRYFEDVRRRRVLANNRRALRILRDAANPFDTTEEVFRSKYRLSKGLAENLIVLLRPYLREPRRAHGIAPELKVLCALHIYAHGSGQNSAACDSNLGVSQPSLSQCLAEVTRALNTPELLTAHVKFPRTREERTAMIHKNYVAFQIPGVLGFVDGTHVAIKSPAHREDIYINRKGYHSMNVQIACDSDLRVLNVLARFPGGAHDSHVWGSSQLREKMQQIFRGGERCWLLGDSGYPEEPWLLIPILHAGEGTPEARYTRMHVKARNAVERCIGVLKQRFRCLTKAHESQYRPEKICAITNACCVLHNMCIDARLPLPDLDVPDLIEENVLHIPAVPLRDGRRGGESLVEEARRVRAAVIQRLN